MAMPQFELDSVHGGHRTHPTSNDVQDMHRMVLPLELHRRFTSLTVFGFACILGATWEYAIVTSLAALTNGGSGGMYAHYPAAGRSHTDCCLGVIWLFFAVMFCMFCVVLSLAEMASM